MEFTISEAVQLRIERARSLVGLGIAFEPGSGGLYPANATPAEKGKLDAAGLVAWSMGETRRPHSKRDFWLSGDTVIMDSSRPSGYFEILDGPEPGAILAIRSTKDRASHLAIVTYVKDRRTFDIVDCSAYSYRHDGDAVAERPGAVLRCESPVYVRPRSG